MNETELERMVIRLIGDGEGYKSMANEAIGVTNALGAEMKRLGGTENEFNAITARAAAVVQASTVAMSEYGRETKMLRGLLDQGMIGLNGFNEHMALQQSLLGPSTQALSEFHKQMLRGAQITAQSETIEEAYKRQIIELRGLLGATAITYEAYTRTKERLRAQLPQVIALQQQEAETLRQQARATQQATQAAQALARQTASDAAQARNRILQEGKAVTDSVRVATEIYADSIRNLNVLVAAGAITHATFDRAVTRAEKELLRATTVAINWGQAITTAGNSIRSFGTSWALYITAPLAAFLGLSLGAGVQMDSLRRGLDSVSGGAEQTAEQLARLKEIAKLPGLGFKEAIEGSVRLQAAGFSARFAERSLMAFGNALASVGQGKSELVMLNRALTQIMGKGKVMAQEINQIAEHLPQIRKAMQGAFGTTNTEALQEMGLSSEKFIEGIIIELEKIPKVTSGAKVDLENFADAAFRSFAKVGGPITEMLHPMLVSATAAIESLGESFGKLPAWIQFPMIGMTAFAASMGPVVFAIGTIIIIAGQLVTAYTALTTSAAAAAIAQYAMAHAATAANLALGGLAVGGILLVMYAIYKSIPAFQEFNDQLEISKKLTDELIKKDRDRVASIQKQAAAMSSGRNRKAFLEEELKLAEKNFAGLTGRIIDARQQLEQALPRGRLSYWSWEGSVEKEMIEALEKKIAVSKEEIDELRKSLGEFKGEDMQAGSATPEQQKNAEDYVLSLRMQADTFGMLSREAKIAEAAIQGVASATLKAMLVEDERLTKMEAQKKQDEEAAKAAEEKKKKAEEFAESITDLKNSLIEEALTMGMSTDEVKRWKLEMGGATAAALASVDALIKAKEALKLADDVSKLNESLEKQIATFGMSKNEILLWELTQRGATTATLAATRGLLAQLDALEAHKKLMEEGKKVTEKYLAPQEKLVAEQQRLQNLLTAGAISLTTYQRAIEDAKKEMIEAQEKADISVNFSVAGNDAVRAGTKEFNDLLNSIGVDQRKAQLEAQADALVPAVVLPGGLAGGGGGMFAVPPELSSLTPSVTDGLAGMSATGEATPFVLDTSSGEVSDGLSGDTKPVVDVLKEVRDLLQEQVDEPQIILKPIGATGL